MTVQKEAEQAKKATSPAAWQVHCFLQQLLSDSAISKGTSDAAIGRYIYNEVWRAFPNSDLKWAMKQYFKKGNPSKQHQKDLDEIL